MVCVCVYVCDTGLELQQKNTLQIYQRGDTLHERAPGPIFFILLIGSVAVNLVSNVECPVRNGLCLKTSNTTLNTWLCNAILLNYQKKTTKKPLLNEPQIWPEGYSGINWQKLSHGMNGTVEIYGNLLLGTPAKTATEYRHWADRETSHGLTGIYTVYYVWYTCIRKVKLLCVDKAL